MIGFDIGGTKCAVTVGRETDGRLVVESKRHIPTDHTASPYELLDRMCALAREQTDDFDLRTELSFRRRICRGGTMFGL